MVEKMSAPTPIQSILDQVTNAAGAKEIREELNLVNEWENIVGKNLATVTRVESWQKGVLKIKVSNPTWKMELYYRLADLQKKIQTASPQLDITRLELV